MDIHHNDIVTSSFWAIYSNLTPSEAEQFVEFSGSALFNKNKQLQKLAAAFHGMYSEKADLNRKTIYETLFGKREYNRQVMNNYLTELKKLLMRYLQILWLEEKNDLKDWALAETFLKKGIFRQFEKVTDHHVTHHLMHSPEEFYFSFRLKQLRDEYEATLAKGRSYHLLEPVITDFRDYYLTETMRMYCELVNRKNLRTQNYNETELRRFLDYFEQVKQSGPVNSLLELYYQVFCFVSNNEDEQAFQRYKELLAAHIGNMPLRTAREICLYGQNQCVRHINLNNEAYLTELFDLYNIMLHHNIIYEGPYMTQYTFKNYVTVALRLKAFDKALAFVDEYRPRLHPDQRHNAYHYNLAAIYFENHAFEKAMDEMGHIHINDPVYYLDSRSILLKIYFDEQDFEALTSLYHSVRVYLLRNKQFPRKQAELYRCLFLYTYKLSRLLGRKNFISLNEYDLQVGKLAEKVHASPVANKTWLLGKLREQVN